MNFSSIRRLNNFYSIRINNQWRIVFQWHNNNASKVEIVDYHKIKKMEKLRNITPGEILLEEFLVPLEITQYRLSKDLEIPQTRISEIVKGNRRITADTAIKLSAYFGNSAKFWLGLQDDYDIEKEMAEKLNEVKRIRKISKERNIA